MKGQAVEVTVGLSSLLPTAASCACRLRNRPCDLQDRRCARGSGPLRVSLASLQDTMEHWCIYPSGREQPHIRLKRTVH